MTYIIKLRRGTVTEWATTNPVLADGEPGIETDTGSLKVGDGVTQWNDLPYISSANTRTSVVKTTASLENNARESGVMTLEDPDTTAYRVYRVSSDKACRLRLYTTVEARDADVGRPINIVPEGDHGVMLDVVHTSTMLSLDLSPIVDAWIPDLPGVVPCTIDNLSGSTGSVAVTLTYVRTE